MKRLRGAVLPLLLVLALVPALIIAGPGGVAHAAEQPVRLSTPGFAWQAYLGTDWDNQADVAARSNLYTKYAGRQEAARAAAVARGTLSAGTVIEGTIVPSTQGPQTLSKGNVITSAGKVASATRFSGLVTKLGAVGVAATGLQIGWAVGSGVAGLFGLDSNGALCQVTGGAAGDCTLPGAGALANADAPTAAGGASGQVVSVLDYATRYTYAAVSVETTPAQPQYSTGRGVRLTLTPTGQQGTSRFYAWLQCSNGVEAGPILAQLAHGAGQTEPWRHDDWSCGRGPDVDVIGVRTAPAEGSQNTPGETTWRWGSYAPPAQTDPLRTFVTTVQCSGGVEVSASSAQFRESADRYPMPPAPTCPAGTSPVSAVVKQTTEGAVAPDAEMARWQQSSDLETQRTAYPDCATRECLLDLLKRQPDGSLLSCFDGAQCAGWTEDATRTQTYQCQYGGKGVELSSCDPYARTFEPEGQAVTDPEASGGTSGGTGVVGDRVCWPQGWSAFNPLEWVYRPLVCAFVPSSAGVSRFKATVATVTARPPISIVTPVVASGVALVDSGFAGCTALPDFSPAQDGTGALPCSPPDSPVWRSLYAMGQIGIVVATIIALVAMVANSFGRTGGAG